MKFFISFTGQVDDTPVTRHQIWDAVREALKPLGMTDIVPEDLTEIETGEKVKVVKHACQEGGFKDGKMLADVDYDEHCDADMSQCAVLHEEPQPGRCRGCGSHTYTLNVLENFYAGCWCSACQI